MFFPFRLIYRFFRFCILTLLGLIVFFSFFLIFLPNISYLRKHNPQTTRFMEIYLEGLKDEGKQPAIDQTWVPISRISPFLRKTILVSEDDAFFEHSGFDWKQIKESLKRDLHNLSFTRGGSTLTQQLVKNLYLGPSKNPLRKIREAIITYQMEHTLSKNRIFELYLNVIEWGPGVYGAEAAAHYYFGESAQNVSASEAAYLAAIIPNPKLLTSGKHSRWVAWKQNLILSRMHYHVNMQEGESFTPTTTVDEPAPPTPPPPEADPVLLDY